MHDVLKKLFDKVIFYEADCIKVGRKLDEEVNTNIEPLRESMSEKELETIRDMIFSASYIAEKNGFYLGIRTALTMFVEAMQLPDDLDKRSFWSNEKDMSSFLGAELQIIENMATKSKGIEHLELVKKSADIQGL